MMPENNKSMTILEALAATAQAHTWKIRTPDGDFSLERYCIAHTDPTRRRHYYKAQCSSHRTSHAECIESCLSYPVDDKKLHHALRTASVSTRWTIVEKDETPCQE